MKLLITGGAGALGRALCRHFLPTAEKVVCVSRNEANQVALRREFAGATNLRTYSKDVRDTVAMIEAMDGVDTVVHAAALKRVDDGTHNAIEMYRINVEGTLSVLRAAWASRCRVLFISSDKAVAPENFYGATKRVAEGLVTAHNTYLAKQGVCAATLRYGNVWDSTEAVQSVWRRQVAAGERLTVTDTSMTSFYLTLEEAAAYVDQALSLMQGGEIFVPILPAWSLGQVATLYAPRAAWDVVGKRAGGEKDHEVLLSEGESERAREIPGMYVVPPEVHEWCATLWTDELPRKPVGWYSSNFTLRVSTKVLEAVR